MENPKHIAFILDGNRRWAKRRGLPSQMGHREGVKAIERTLKALCEENIPFATFYCFSTENWKRSKEEVDGLMKLSEEYFSKGLGFFSELGIRVEFFGDKSAFSKELQEIMSNAEEKTAKNTRLRAGFCLNYGGKEEIVRAVNLALKSGKKEIVAADISQNLYTRDFPDPDLVVRTSGEMRLSNFQIWQTSYSELYFPRLMWPDFDKKQLKKSLKVYSKRKRRFGGN